MTLVVKPRIITYCLGVVIAGLSFAHFVSQYLKYVHGYTHQWGLERQFDLVNEATLSSWYSAVALLFSAVLLGMIAHSEWRTDGKDARHWTGLALLFLYLSLDEAAQIHEMMTLLDRIHPTGIFFYSWIIVGGVFALVVGLLYLGFLRRLPSSTRWVFVCAGALYVGGAVGVEMLESWHHYVSHSWKDLSYALMVGVEETLEMSGSAVFIHGLTSYVAESGMAYTIQFVDDRHRRSTAELPS